MSAAWPAVYAEVYLPAKYTVELFTTCRDSYNSLPLVAQFHGGDESES